ncbi:F-box/LRR-repeat protein At3g26922-like [Cornus florida]|uniref:F-box/LRR-repeat protein At3g26922-like n=1 Tax=Cornus florida TaxID=4283 RepID=UPI00289B4AE4|nr:F-box/LRR-repeat protein At3g26922-like [Cornus florida]
MTEGVQRALENDKQKVDLHLEDRISQLPDDVLVLILSFLTFKEATVTSVLSSRWTYLWTHYARLVFDYQELYDDKEPYIYGRENYETKRVRYVNWVNRVVQLYRGSSIEEFCVRFDLGEGSECDVNKWLKFALAKRIQRLELDLIGFLHNEKRPYIFSYQLLAQSKCTTSNFCGMRPCTFVGFNTLKAIFLKNVNVGGGEVLEYFLSNCPVLEQMGVHYCEDLFNLKVVGPSLVLKQLEICYCWEIKSIEIRNVNLVSLKVLGEDISFLLENVPMLVDLNIDGRISKALTDIDGWISRSLTDVFAQFACCLSQLEILTLDTHLYCIFEENAEFDVSSKLTNLRKLVLVGVEIVHRFASLIKAAPYLKKLVLQIGWSTHDYHRNLFRTEKCVHQCLEEVEFFGYYGSAGDRELVECLFENAIALKRIVIDARNPLLPEGPCPESELETEKAARNRAEQLKKIVPAGVELVIVDHMLENWEFE